MTLGKHSKNRILNYADVKNRDALASNRATKRILRNRTRKQSTLMDYWPTLIPDSLPIRPSGEPRSLLLLNSLHNMGWKPHPTFVICPDPIRDTHYPFPHSPPDSPHPVDKPISSPKGQMTPPPEVLTQKCHYHMEASPSASPPHTDTMTTPKRAQDPAERSQSLVAASSTATNLTLLTINVQKVGANSPSLADVVAMLDGHSPDILFLTETPLHIRGGALTHVFRNRGYRMHYHPANVPSPPNALPEARIPDHLTHAGGGYWLA